MIMATLYDGKMAQIFDAMYQVFIDYDAEYQFYKQFIEYCEKNNFYKSAWEYSYEV